MGIKTIPDNIAIAASNYACQIATRQPIQKERAVAMVNSAINGSVMRGVWSEVVCAFVAGYEFSKPCRDRIAELEANAIGRGAWIDGLETQIAELEAENAQLRSVFVPPGSALVLVAPEAASQDEMRDAANRASEVHDGPVILLAHDWRSMPIDELRAEIARVDRVPPSLICTCPASSEYDNPCPRHGVLGIGVTGRD